MVTVAALVALGTALAACGSGSSSGGSSKAALAVADLAPFTGADAALGPTYLASCMGATNAINSAGGVLGHKMTCNQVDTRGDPADAVPATRQMFATTSNLALVIGVTSDEAAAVVPISTAPCSAGGTGGGMRPRRSPEPTRCWTGSGSASSPTTTPASWAAGSAGLLRSCAPHGRAQGSAARRADGRPAPKPCPQDRQ